MIPSSPLLSSIPQANSLGKSADENSQKAETSKKNAFASLLEDRYSAVKEKTPAESKPTPSVTKPFSNRNAKPAAWRNKTTVQANRVRANLVNEQVSSLPKVSDIASASQPNENFSEADSNFEDSDSRKASVDLSVTAVTQPSLASDDYTRVYNAACLTSQPPDESQNSAPDGSLTTAVTEDGTILAEDSAKGVSPPEVGTSLHAETNIGANVLNQEKNKTDKESAIGKETALLQATTLTAAEKSIPSSNPAIPAAAASTDMAKTAESPIRSALNKADDSVVQADANSDVSPDPGSILKDAPSANLTSESKTALEVKIDQKDTAGNKGSDGQSSDSPRDGMPDAFSKSQMKLADKWNQIAPQTEQKLPKRDSGLDGMEKLGPARTDRRTELSPTNLLTVNSLDGTAGKAAAIVAATPEVAAPAVNSAVQVEKLTELMSRQTVELKLSNNLQMTAVLRPDAQTELHLDLRIVPEGVEIHARCESNGAQALNDQWSQIQQALAPHGIRLGNLNDSHWTPDRNSGGSFDPSQQQSSDHQEARRQQAPASLEEKPTLTASAPGTASRRNPRIARADGLRWESWA